VGRRSGIARAAVTAELMATVTVTTSATVTAATAGAPSAAPPRVPPPAAVLPPETFGARVVRVVAEAVPVTAAVATAAFLRLHDLTAVGYNSDEAVYAGTAASMAGDTGLQGMFPVFRAHPLLFQTLVSVMYGRWPGESAGRVTAAVVGVLAVVMTYLIARRLYGPVAGAVAGVFLAVMPYHVLVSRQVLLDGLLVLFATVALYCVVRYCEQASMRWLVAAGAMMGLATLSKETAVVLVGSLYGFFAVTTSVKVRVRDIAASLGVMGLVVLAFPYVVAQSGKSTTGQNYFLWQLSRRPNHDTWFYAQVVPPAVGWLLIAAAVAGLVWLRRLNGWRESLMLWWVAVPAVFFTLWPVKGYQYLLPLAPVIALLAARTVANLARLKPVVNRRRPRRILIAVAASALATSLAVPSWALVTPSSGGTFLAGTGGVPGGRETGLWLHERVPAGAQLLAVGPSMANILQFYGRHRVYGLSVSANPRDRNPAYTPVSNPDLWVRSGRVQYLVWDSYSAERTPFFTAKLTALVERYHGVAVHTATVDVPTASGATAPKPVVIVYQVWVS
jgi:Dolichyl-phosphate-mannose-protein mannosyltransferase